MFPLRRVPFTDITGLQLLEEVIGKLQKRRVRVMVCEANFRVHTKLLKAGVLELLQDEDYAEEFGPLLAQANRFISDATEARTQALGQHAQNLLRTSRSFFSQNDS